MLAADPEDLRQATRRLSERSHGDGVDPADRISWPANASAQEGWWCVPEDVSLFGTGAWNELSLERQRALAFQEFHHLCAANVRGEADLVSAVRPCLAFVRGERRRYLDHLITEEQRHSAVFLRFCRDYGGGLPPSLGLRLRSNEQAGDAPQGTRELLVFGRILLFEELVDARDRRAARDLRVAPLARAIHGYHHADEVRHRGFGRRLVAELAEQQSRAALAHCRDALALFLEIAWREFEPASAYRAAQLSEPAALARMVRTHPAAQARRRRLSASALQFFQAQGLLPECSDLPALSHPS